MCTCFLERIRKGLENKSMLMMMKLRSLINDQRRLSNRKRPPTTTLSLHYFRTTGILLCHADITLNTVWFPQRNAHQGNPFCFTWLCVQFWGYVLVVLAVTLKRRVCVCVKWKVIRTPVSLQVRIKWLKPFIQIFHSFLILSDSHVTRIISLAVAIFPSEHWQTQT